MPKKIRKLFGAAQGANKMDLDELLGRLPQGTPAQKLEAELMFKRLQEEQAARYAPTNPPTERGKEALRQAQNQLRERGKQKFLEPSAEKRRMYHGTRHYKPGIGTFDPQNRPTGEGITEFSLSDRGMAFVSPEVSFANTYAGEPMDAVFKSGAVYPVHVQVRNPFDFENADHLDMMVEELSKTIGGSPETREALRRGHWDVIESPPVIEAAKRLGFDGMYMREAGMKNLGVFDPKRIKSAIGNEGTYDIENPDITKAKGGLAHMAGGGKTRAGTKAKPFPWEEQYERSKQRLTNLVNNPMEELQAIVQQYLPTQGDSPEERARKLDDLAMGFAGTTIGKTPRISKAQAIESGLYHPVGAGKKLARPVHEVEFTRVPDPNMPMAPEIRITPEDLFKKQGYPVPWDASAAGELLTGMGGKMFETPVVLQGGIGYQRTHGGTHSPQKLAVASQPGVITRHSNIIQRIASEGDDPVSVVLAMSPGHGLDYNKMLANTLVQQLNNAKISTKLAKEFDEEIRSAHPEFVGVKSKKLADQLNADTSGELRKTFAKRMMLDQFQKGGFPDVIESRVAISTPEMLHSPVGSGGLSFGLMDPAGGIITNPINPHDTYRASSEGKYLGGTGVRFSTEELFPEFFEQRRLLGGDPKDDWYTFGRTMPTQRFDQRWLDRIMPLYEQRIKELTGKKDGGVVHMQGGGNPGEVSGEMFSPKPLTIPAPLTDLADMIRRQFSKEKRSYSKPGAATDVLLGDVAAPILGAPGDFLDDLGQILDHVQKTHPLMREKASVMDTGPERTPPMGYAPKIRFSSEGNAPYGSEQIREGMERHGLISGERRPLTGLAASILAPGAITKGYKLGKTLAPTAADIMETQLLRATEPMRMNIVPEGGPSGKLKAPANELGFYNPVEKAALNVQRKQGPGSAMVSDLKKTPGVNDERLAELGLGDLASRPNVTREELLAATQENRIPLRETVRTEGGKTLEELNDDIYQLKEDMSYMDNDSREWAEADRALTRLEREYEQEKNAGRAMFGPKTHADYNMPGGRNYREIRVGLPSNRPSIKDMSREEYNAAVAKADAEGVNDFTHSTHHGDEPNVLFHLRVADHVDADGKKGLLIDELQSDWHQQGREKGYGDKLRFGYSIVEQEPGFFTLKKQGMSMPMAYGTKDHIIDRARYYNAFEKGVPEAPFKDNWYQLGLKRAIKEAADTGMDRVYLTTGKRQISRYEDALRANVDAIEYEPFKGENGELMFEIAGIKNGKSIIEKDGLTYQELQDLVGKDMAEKMKNNAGESLAKERPMRPNWMRLSSDDLSIGGEGMKQYYDKTYKNFLDKYAKQFGARVGETRLPGASITRDQLSAKEMHNMMDNPEFKKILDEEFIRVANEPRITGKVESQGPGQFKVVWSDGTMSGGYSEQGARDRLALGRSKTPLEKQAWNAALKRFGGEKVYYIDITPKMRESAQKGQSYKDGGAVRMAEGGAVDYESVFNQMLQDHVGMAQGGAVDYESRFNDMLQKYVQGMAEGGAVNPYNEDPDMSDGGRFIPAPAFADGGAVKSIWTVN